MKSELRKQVLHEMKAIPRTQKVTMDLALTDQFLKHPLLPKKPRSIATYLLFSS